MARIQSYQNDLSIDGSEKLIGTNNVSSSTTNFVINDIADWMNSHSVIGIAGQTVYKFQSSVGDGRDRGSISFEGYGGQGTLFSDITTMRISKYNLRNVDITEYLNWSVGKDINFFDVNNVSSFGIYAVESLTAVDGTDFFDIVLRHDSSNGSLQEGSYYGISVKSNFDATSALFIGDKFSAGLTDELEAIRDGLGTESKLRLSKGKTEIQDSVIVRSSTNPTMRLIADNPDNPTTGERMGTLRFTRNFEDPLALDLARAIFADFTERVTADGGIVEGTEECVASELELIVSGEYLINMVDIRPEYTGTLASTKSDLVFYLNDGGGSPEEKFRITQEGNIEVKDSLSGVVIRSRNNTPYRILVDNDGRLEATALDAAAPVINGVPTISGLVAITETITATPASVTSSPALTTTYQWQVSDNGTTGWSNISGATSSTYLIPLEYANKFLRLQQIETNILGQATANSASTTAVIPSLLVTAMIQRLGNFENETYVYDSLVDFDAIELS